MSTASQQQRCPKCGGPIPPEAPEGLCPKCLLAEVSIPTEAGHASKSAPPRNEELAAAFPHLEILELVGQGGMGFVFKARQPKLDRFVALKILPQSLAADPAFAERFTREGRMLARLNHPNIVTIHDFGLANGFFYLLMEFVDGVNLRQAMQAGRFTPEQALAIVPKICEALQFAHNERILHRDIKPENILIDARGRVKIADFGIAKLVGEVQPETHLTGSGATLGTPHYMAPEQIEKPAQVDHRADIYSLGVVFYEMLTGELPLGRFAPPSEKTTADPRLDDVVLRTLEKEPARRPQSAGEIKTRVETIASTPSETVVIPSGPDRLGTSSRTAALAFALLYVGLLCFLALSAPFLPERVATHFNEDGHPDGWMRRSWELLFVSAMPLFCLALFWGLSRLINRLPDNLINIPRRDYWLTPARRPILSAFLKRRLLWLVCLVVCFFGGIHYLILQANQSAPPHLSSTGIMLVAFEFLVALMLWASSLLLSLADPDRRPPTSRLTANRPPPPAWMKHAGILFAVLGALALFPTFLSIGTDRYVWHGASLFVFTGIALLTRDHVWRGFALLFNSLMGLVVVWNVGYFYLLSAGGKLPPHWTSGGAGLWEFIPEGIVLGILQAAVFAAGIWALCRKDVKHAFGPRPDWSDLLRPRRWMWPLAVCAFMLFLNLGLPQLGIRFAKPTALNERREDPDRLAQEGWQLWQTRGLDEAAQKFRSAVALAPDNANAWNGLGWASFNSGQTEEAENAFQRAIALKPNLPGALNGLGQIYLSQRKYELAEAHLLKAAPQAPAAWYGLARLYLIQNKFDEAEKWAQKVVASGQGDDVARKMLKAAQARQLDEELRLVIEPAGLIADSNDSPPETGPSVLQFRLVADAADADSPADELVELRNGKTNQLRILRRVLMDGSAVKRAGIELHADGHRTIGVELTEDGARQLRSISGKNISRQLAIVADGRILSAPIIRTPISSGELKIDGSLSADEAHKLVAALNRTSAAKTFSRPIELSLPRRGPSLQDVSLDLDSGNMLTNDSARGDQAVSQDWLREIGGDLTAFGSIHDLPLLYAPGLQSTSVTGRANDSIQPADVAWNWTLTRNNLKQDTLLGTGPGLPDTFLFRTRENTFGILQILDATNPAPSVKIRYKLVLDDQSESKKARLAPIAAPPSDLESQGKADKNVLPTTNTMRSLATRICEGDNTAFGELRAIATELYREIDFAKEPERARNNLLLMRAAFRELGEQAGRSNAHALAALQSAAFTRQLKSHVDEALGIAAASGNEHALDMLLQHQDWNILLSSAVFALRAPAEKNNERAIDFLIAVLENPKHRPLWNGAANGLKVAATNGNAKAKAALEKHERENPKPASNSRGGAKRESPAANAP